MSSSYVPPALRARQGGGGDPPSTSDGARGGFERSGSSGAFGGGDRGRSAGGDRGGGAGAGGGGGGGAGGGDRWGSGGPSSGGPPERRPPLFRSGSTSSLGGGDGGGPRTGGGGGGGSSSYGRGGGGGRDPPPVVIGEHKLSDRVNALTEEQVEEIRGRLNVTVEVEEGESPAAPPVESFKEMNLHANILQDIASHDYETPTPIQAQGIPVALSGRDVLGCAETGSGKTASFAIPLVQHCLSQPPLRPGDGPLALVLAPTRELAQQIDKEVAAFSHASGRAVRTAIVVGGVSMGDQRHELRSGAEVVVATPGRLIDHLQQGNTSLARVSYVVLDEADRMLDMGFEPQIRDVLGSLHPTRQTLLFSATMPPEIESLAAQYLNKPVKVKIGRVSVPTANVAQTLERCADAQKVELLTAMLHDELEQQRQGGPPMPLTIVFVERKTRCDEVAAALLGEGVPSAALHGGLSQGEREAALRDFSAGHARVLVATDVASRGLDVKGIGHVVNMDLPRAFEDYVHRIGRTGRAGTRGRATSFYTDRDAFLVSQIKTALQELERGNASAFAVGKEARAAERALAAKFRQSMKMGSAGLVPAVSGGGAGGDDAGAPPPVVVKVADKYSHMAAAAASGALAAAGSADAAWDD